MSVTVLRPWRNETEALTRFSLDAVGAGARAFKPPSVLHSPCTEDQELEDFSTTEMTLRNPELVARTDGFASLNVTFPSHSCIG